MWTTIQILCALLLAAITVAPITSSEGDDAGAAAENRPIPSWAQVRPQEEAALIGIGEASGEHARQQSRALAVVDISEQLVISIRSSSEAETSSETTADDTSSQVQMREYLKRRIESDTEAHFLPGVEIVAQERVGDTVYTMARLHRQHFVEAVEQRAEAIDDGLKPLARLDDSLTADTIGAWQRGRQLAEERERLAALLGTLGHNLDAAPVSWEDIERRLGRLARGTRLRLEGSDRAPTTRDAILEMIDLSGLTIIQGEEAAFELRLRERSRSRQVGEWHRVTITAAVTAVDRSSGEVIGSLEHSVEKSSVQGEGEASARAREALISEFSALLQQRLLALLAGSPRPSTNEGP